MVWYAIVILRKFDPNLSITLGFKKIWSHVTFYIQVYNLRNYSMSCHFFRQQITMLPHLLLLAPVNSLLKCDIEIVAFMCRSDIFSKFPKSWGLTQIRGPSLKGKSLSLSLNLYKNDWFLQQKSQFFCQQEKLLSMTITNQYNIWNFNVVAINTINPSLQ